MHLIAIIIIILNLSYFHLWVAALVGLSFQPIGIAFIVFGFIYLSVNYRLLVFLLNSKWVVLFLFLAGLFPLLSIVYSPLIPPPLRFIGYEVLNVSLLLVTIVYIGLKGVYRFGFYCYIAWFIAATGILLSFIRPDLFHSIQLMQAGGEAAINPFVEVRAATEHQGRAFGFYMQPNRAALALVILMLITATSYLERRLLLRLMVVSATGICVLLTGSRGGFLIFITSVLLMVYLEFRRGGVPTLTGFLPFSRVFQAYLVLFAMLLVGLGVTFASGDREFSQIGSVSVRVGSLAEGSSLLNEDQSVGSRINVVFVYLDRIKDRPLFGHGFISTQYERGRGLLPMASHNSILEMAFLYGIPYTMIFWGIFVYLQQLNRRRLRNWYFYDMGMIFIAPLVVGSLVQNTVFDSRYVMIFIGWYFSICLFRRSIPRDIPPVSQIESRVYAPSAQSM